MPKKLDLTGQKFGRLTVIEEAGRGKNGNVKWRCKCDCGNTKIVITEYLRSGKVKSCGCLHRGDLTGQKFGRLTVIEEVGRSKQKAVKWRCKCECGNETIVTSISLRSGNTKSCGCLQELSRKKTHEKLKKDNLKEGTCLFNLTEKISRNNTSGVKGVSYHKKKKKWYARIMFKGKNHYLGYFTNKQDAINARKKAEEELFDPILKKYNKKKAD